MATKLGLYNGCLLHLGERKLASLTESREPRRALDDAYDETLRFCLEQGFWNFAMRAVQIDSSASVTPTFGYSFAFPKPTDWIRTHTLSAEETMTTALRDKEIVDEPNYWYANSDPLFVRYVSDSLAYGLDLSLWPETFTDYVQKRLAVQTCNRITGSDTKLEDLLKREKRAKADALSKDAMNEPPGEPPTGSWVRSRSGWNTSSTRWDRASS